MRHQKDQLRRIRSEDAVQMRLQAAMRAEERRQQRAQARLKRQVDLAQIEQDKRLRNKTCSQELEHELLQITGNIRQAEQMELAIISRLQSSQALRDNLADELSAIQDVSAQSSSCGDLPALQAIAGPPSALLPGPSPLMPLASLHPGPAQSNYCNSEAVVAAKVMPAKSPVTRLQS